MRLHYRPLCCAFLIGLIVLTAQAAHAANGMNMIGFAGRSTAMAGADLAVTDSPAAMNINPAGIGWCVDPELDFGLSLMDPSLEHTDMLGNRRSDSLGRIPMPFLGYVQPRGKMTWGVGLFVQGGLGAEYENLTTPMAVLFNSGMFPPGTFGNSVIPNTDDVKTQLAHAKLTPTVAWRVGSNMTVGASLNVSYARAEMKFFPETSLLADLNMSGTPGDAPGEAFSGMHVDDVHALDFGLRVGFQYRRDRLMIGGSYFTETGLDFEDGTMTLNLSAMGLGKVEYDAEIADFAWPERVGLGIGYQITDNLLIAADADWVNWADAIETLTIKLSNPDHAMAPPTREIPFVMNWEDQWIWALGFELTPRDKWAVRWGYNHGDAPIPETTLRPQFPAIAEDHLTAGLGYSSGPWTFNLGLEYVFESEKTNNSTDAMLNPFGPGSTETLSQFMAHLTMRRKFGS